MTILEKFFGITIKINNELEPHSLAKIGKAARDFSFRLGFNLNDYFVYVHRIQVIDSPHSFHEAIDLHKRVKYFDVSFRVNPKQIKNGKIRFCNEEVDIPIDRGVREALSPTEVIRMYTGKYISKKSNLETNLITFVDKTLRKKAHKKIKICLSACPSKDYFEVLKKSKRDSFTTYLDLPLEKQAELNNSLDSNKSLKLRKELKLKFKSYNMYEVQRFQKEINEESVPFDKTFNSSSNKIDLVNNISMNSNNFEKTQIQQVGGVNNSTNNSFKQTNLGDSNSMDFELVQNQLNIIHILAKDKLGQDSKTTMALNEAILAAENKDQKTLMQKLKAAGGPALEFTRDLAVDITASLIKKSAGLE